mgnify:CR=1 FL=1|jgi:hypothetical protein
MNEQLIGDLFAEAMRQLTGSTSREFSQKFAELIVQECCKEISYASVGREDPVFAYAYIDHLRNTFGVEKC